jgi:hypothetical protein
MTAVSLADFYNLRSIFSLIPNHSKDEMIIRNCTMRHHEESEEQILHTLEICIVNTFVASLGIRRDCRILHPSWSKAIIIDKLK